MNNNNFSEKVLKLSIAGIARSEHGENLDIIIDDCRNEPIGKSVADLLFNYFRNKAFIDSLIEQFIGNGKKNNKSTPAKFKRILAVVLTQSLFQTGIDLHIAVDVAVGFSKKKHGTRIAGFINAVLRRSLSAGVDKLKKMAAGETFLNIPSLVMTRWEKDFTAGEIAEFAAIFSIKAPLSFRVINEIPEAELENAGCRRLEMPNWAESYRFYESGIPKLLFEKDWLEKGHIYIQDLSTLSPCLFYKPGRNEVIYDLCSAPGGKSVLLNERMESGKLIASDISFSRQMRTLENLTKSNNRNTVCLLVASALKPALKERTADYVFLDVPCTNTGVVRRRPDVLWNFSEKKLAELTAIQAEMLHEAAILLKAGGALIYSTCSIEKEENKDQIERFLTRHPEFTLLNKRKLMPSRIHDGGYAALLRKS